jgi:hypothetical protein
MLFWYVLAFGYGLCLLGFIRALVKAPQGYEDEQGFHFGPEPERDDYIDRPLIRPATWREERPAATPERGVEQG